jgi:hypothetical protein
VQLKVLQQLQLYVPAGTRDPWGQVSSIPTPVFVRYILLQALYINLITNYRRPSFTVTSICVELSRPSYCTLNLLVPNDPRRLSPPDAKVEVAVRDTATST